MNEIIADTYRLVDSRSDECVVSQIAEYTRAYQRVLEAAHAREVGDKKILRVDCLPNPMPVFLNIAGQDELYIRTGPATVQLSAREVLEYTGKHF
jgi:hypothetical protein